MGDFVLQPLAPLPDAGHLIRVKVVKPRRQGKSRKKTRAYGGRGGAMTAKRDTIVEDVMAQDISYLNLDGDAIVAGAGYFNAKLGVFGRKITRGKIKINQHKLNLILNAYSRGKINRSTAQKKMRELVKESVNRPRKKFVDAKGVCGEFVDTHGPRGHSYVDLGRGEVAGTDRPDYSSPLVKRGVSATADDGFPASARQNVKVGTKRKAE